MVGRPFGMALPVEFLSPTGDSWITPFTAGMAQALGGNRASSVAAFCLGRRHPTLFYNRKRVTHGELQLRSMARDLFAVGGWHLAGRENGPSGGKACQATLVRGL